MSARGARRAALLAATRRLALAKGLPATTVDEICDAAGATKGSFYHYFSSKDEIGLQALAAYFEELTAALRDGDWPQGPTALARLTAFLDHAAQVSIGPALQHGCLMGSFALDLAETSPAVQAELSRMFGALREVAGGLIAAAADETGAAVDAAGLADHLLAVLEGALILAKSHRDADLPARTLASYGQCLQALLGAPAPA